MAFRPVTPRQRGGGEYTGRVQQNTLQPRPVVSDMSAADQRRLIVTTGQDTDPGATARMRNFLGQEGPKPKEPPLPRPL